MKETRIDFVPTTISPEAQQMLQTMYEAKAYAAPLPAPDDLEGWRKTHDAAWKVRNRLGKQLVLEVRSHSA